VRRRVLLLAPTCATALALVGPGYSDTTAWRVIGQASGGAEAAVTASAGRPAQIAVRVTAGRGATISGTAVVACGNSYRGGRAAATRFSGPSRLFRLVRLPLTTQDCDVVAGASSTGGGRVVIQILER
jgi:hypothetical protein